MSVLLLYNLHVMHAKFGDLKKNKKKRNLDCVKKEDVFLLFFVLNKVNIKLLKIQKQDNNLRRK